MSRAAAPRFDDAVAQGGVTLSTACIASPHLPLYYLRQSQAIFFSGALLINGT